MARKAFLALVEALSHDLKPLRSKSPKKGSWGFYYRGAASAAVGGISGYHWEASRAGIIRFLRNYALTMSLPCVGLNLLTINTKVERITEAMKAGTLSDVAAINALNKALQQVVQLDWMGEYVELRDRNTRYAKALRKRFRDGGSAAPIAKNEKADWLLFLDQARL